MMQAQMKATALSCFDCSKSLQSFARKYASGTFTSKPKPQIFWTTQGPKLTHVLPRTFSLENLSKSRTKISISRTSDEQISSTRSIKSFSYGSLSTISSPSFLKFTVDVRKFPNMQLRFFSSQSSLHKVFNVNSKPKKSNENHNTNKQNGDAKPPSKEQPPSDKEPPNGKKTEPPPENKDSDKQDRIGGLLARLRLILNRFKPWTLDQIWALLSIFTVGTTALVIVGTTTAISILLWVANTFEFSEYITKKVSEYLSQMSGISITYKSAKGTNLWKDGTIRLKGVKIRREYPGYSTIDLDIEDLDVILSVLWWLEGKGFVKEARMKGVRGTVDRRVEIYPKDWKPTRRKWQRGDFELSRMRVEDLLITIWMPDPDFRSLSLSIFEMDVDMFRKQWFLYDLFRANTIVGIFDGCLFKYGPSQHPRRRESNRREMHLKLDGLNTDLIANKATGPLGWVKEGTLDISLHVLIPRDPPSTGYYHTHEQQHVERELDDPTDRAMIFLTKVRLNYIKLNPPVYTPEISYLSNALIHPIASYMNTHSKHIPLQFKMELPEPNWDGAWTPAEAGIWDRLSEAVYNALVMEIAEQRKQTDWRKVVGYIWKYLFG